MDNKTILSIIMPVYNHKELVKVMIDSILRNSFSDWELLAVDDGSDQETMDLLQSYAEKDPRIILIKRNRLPKGAPTCRNIGFEKAKGKYIAFFDSDDYITPECLKTRVECMENRKDLDFMVFPSGTYDDKGFHIEPNKFNYGYPIYNDDLEHFARRLLPFVVWNNIYRTQTLRQKGILWDEQLLSLQDADFNVQTLMANMRYDYAQTQPDYGYRLSTTSSVSKGLTTVEHFRSHIYAIRKMYSAIRQKKGNTYDKALFYGLLRLYNGVVTGEGINPQLTKMFADGIRDIAPNHALKLERISRIALRLKKITPFLSPKTARQIPMLPFLLSHRRRQKRKLACLRNIPNERISHV